MTDPYTIANRLENEFLNGFNSGIFDGYAMGIISAAMTCKNPSQAAPIILNGIEYVGPETMKKVLQARIGETCWQYDLIYSLCDQNHIIKD